MKDIRKILFICTGNSCRSVMAEAYLNRIITLRGWGFEIRSAGTMGIEGASPSREVKALLGREGIDTSGLRSTGLSKDIVEWADLILVMAPEHKLAVLSLSPSSESKVRYLGEFDPDRGEIMIPDPIGRGQAFYAASFNVIKRSIEELVKWLEE